MSIGLVLGLAKLALEIFQDERRDRFLKKYLKIEREYQDEMAKDEDSISDLTLDRLLFESEQLARLILSEAKRN